MRFPLTEQAEREELRYHEVYSTKQNAQRIASLELAIGDAIRATSVFHQDENRQRSFYAYGVKRLNEESS